MPPASFPSASRPSADEGAVVSDSDSLADDSVKSAFLDDSASADDLEFMSGFLQGALDADLPLPLGIPA